MILSGMFGAAGHVASGATTAALLHFDGTGSTFVDATGKTCTAYGAATQSATQSVFGGKALDLTGGAGRVEIADSTDFDFGTGPFVIEWRERRTANTDYQNPWSRGYNLPGGMFMQSDPPGTGLRTLYFMDPSGTPKQILLVPVFSLDQWVAIAIQRDATGKVTCFLDGVPRASGGPSADTMLPLGLRAPFVVGSDSASSYWTRGYIDEFRVTKGAALYPAGGYTPAASAFTYP